MKSTKSLKLDVVVIKGRVRCVYINDYRVVGGKPYAAEHPQFQTFDVEVDSLKVAMKKRVAS